MIDSDLYSVSKDGSSFAQIDQNENNPQTVSYLCSQLISLERKVDAQNERLKQLDVLEERLQALEGSKGPVNSPQTSEDRDQQVPSSPPRGRSRLSPRVGSSFVRQMMLKTWGQSELVGVNLTGRGPKGFNNKKINEGKLDAYISFGLSLWATNQKVKNPASDEKVNASNIRKNIRRRIGSWLSKALKELKTLQGRRD